MTPALYFADESHAAFHGGLMGLFLAHKANPERVLLIKKIRPVHDAEGNYTNILEVEMESGRVYTIQTRLSHAPIVALHRQDDRPEPGDPQQ
jgi:hypothetical protein